MELLPPGALDELLAGYPEDLDIDQASAILRISPDRVGKLLRQDRIPGYKVGRTWHIPLAGVRELLRVGANRAAQALDRGQTPPTLAELAPEMFGRRATDPPAARRATD